MSGKNPMEVLAPDEGGIAHAVELLRGGGLVALPTETVYGLAARADSEAAVGRIYSAKGRPDFNPLIVHVASMEMAESLAIFDDRARLLAKRYWPGPLTIVLPLRPGAPIAAAVTAGLSTIALRMPAHPAMRAILNGAGVPLAAPSANRSGAISPTAAGHIIASLGGRIDAVVDGGACEAGLESTIVALREGGDWQLLRPGPITEAEVAETLGRPQYVSSMKIEAPGQLASHYSPGKPLRLDAISAEADEFLIGFGTVAGACTLSASGDLTEAAARLYACLYLGASAVEPQIAVAPIPNEGIGAAIRDRLARAAA
jgi:L-threonylcarbamoyladenylate synthase